MSWLPAPQFTATARKELVPRPVAPEPETSAPAKKKTAVYNLTLEQIEAIKRQAAKDAVQEVMELTLGLPCMVLKDKFGFGKIRLKRFIDRLLELYDSYDKGYLSLEDVRNVLKEEGGIVLRLKKGRKKR